MNKQQLTEFYSLDPNFIATYHGLTDMSIENCVNDTWEIIKDAKSYVHDFGYFTIDDTLDIIPRLTGFFIKPEYRDSATFSVFYTEVCKRTPKYFIATAHKNNIKVVNFLTKLGGNLLNIESKEDMLYFLLNQGSL